MWTLHTPMLFFLQYTPQLELLLTQNLIDSIFYNDVTKNIISKNIATSISDHLTQFLLISNQNPFSKNQMLNTDEKRSFRNINSVAFGSLCLKKILTCHSKLFLI